MGRVSEAPIRVGSEAPLSFGVDEIIMFCADLRPSQAEQVKEQARGFIAYVRSLSDGEADLLAAIVEHGAAIRLAMGMEAAGSR